MTIWVVNTSPLIFLSHLDRLNLLQSEGREVFIPRAVLDEVVTREDKKTRGQVFTLAFVLAAVKKGTR